MVIHYGRPVSWMHSARGYEKIDFLLNGRRAASSTMTGNMKLVEYAPDNSLGIWKNDNNSFDAMAQRWEAGERKTGSFWKDMETQSLKNSFRGKDFQGLMKNFTFAGEKIVRWESISSLRDYLILNPSECGRVSDYLLAGSLNSVQQAALIHVLELAGHNEAQAALVQIMNNGTHSPMNRMRSIVALSGVPEPNDASVESLIRAYHDRRGSAEAEISNTSALGLGNMSRSLARLEGNENAGNRRNRINEFLMKEFGGTSGDVGKTVLFLAAIGNTGDASFTDAIRNSINDENMRVRGAAVRAIVTVGDETARQAVVERLHVEEQKEVKIAILDSLTGKPGMESAVLYIRDAIGGEKDYLVRKSMLTYLVKNREAYPEIKKTFQRLVETEADAQNLKLIYQGLYSKQKR